MADLLISVILAALICVAAILLGSLKKKILQGPLKRIGSN